jgi:thioredoxin-dependent peroxiredoxin
MPPIKKRSAEPTRRSERTASRGAIAVVPPAKPAPAAPTPQKRNIEPAGGPPKPAPVEQPEAKKPKKRLVVGDKLPDLTLLNEDGDSVKVIELTAEKGIILFAYPKASTPGCTKQVRLYAPRASIFIEGN